MAGKPTIREAAQAVVDAGYVIANWGDYEGDFADFLAALAVLEDTLNRPTASQQIHVHMNQPPPEPAV